MAHRPKRRMSDERRRVLDFIVAFDARAGRGPSYSEMEVGAGVSRSVLFTHVRELEAAGHLTRDERTRAIVVARGRPADPAELRACVACLAAALRGTGLVREPAQAEALAWSDRLLGVPADA